MSTVSSASKTLGNLVRKGWDAWEHYWFLPAPLFDLAMCRIIVVGFQLGYLFAQDYWSQVLARESLPGVQFTPLPIFQLLNVLFPWSAPPSAFLATMFIITVVSGVFSLIGWKCRINLGLFAVGNLYLQTYLYSFGKHHHSQALLLMTLFILLLSPAGQALSLDDLSKRIRKSEHQKRFEPFSILKRKHMSARWPLMLVRGLFAIVYLSAGLNKLLPTGSRLISLDWFNGYTLQYYLLRDGLTWGSDLGVWLSQLHGFAILSSWFAILFEVTFGLTLIFPRLAWIYVPMGAALHTGIYMAQRAPFFQYIALYSVFVPWTVAVKRIANVLRWSKDRRKAEVIYDERCPFLIRVMTVLCYFDWFNRIRYRPSALKSGVVFHAPDGEVQRSFLALRSLTRYVPALWPLWAILHVPGVPAIGTKVCREQIKVASAEKAVV